MKPWVPEFKGELRLSRIPDDFIFRIRKRVDEGLLVPGSRHRAKYAVRSATRDEVAFAAEGFLAAYNIGLNEVTVRRAGPDTIQYEVSFWRWTRFAVAHSLFITLLFAVCFASASSVREQVASQANGTALLAGLLLFFCVLWPWILTAIHRRFAERALRRILLEVLS